jgi:hypothetical protein
MHVYVHLNISNYLSHFSKQKSRDCSPHNVHNCLVLGTTVYLRHLYFQVSQMGGSVGKWNSFITTAVAEESLFVCHNISLYL